MQYCTARSYIVTDVYYSSLCVLCTMRSRLATCIVQQHSTQATHAQKGQGSLNQAWGVIRPLHLYCMPAGFLSIEPQTKTSVNHPLVHRDLCAEFLLSVTVNREKTEKTDIQAAQYRYCQCRQPGMQYKYQVNILRYRYLQFLCWCTLPRSRVG